MSMAQFDRCLPPSDRNDAPMLARPADVAEPADEMVQLRRILQGAQAALDRLTHALGAGDQEAAERAAWELNEALMMDARALSVRVRISIAGPAKRRRPS